MRAEPDIDAGARWFSPAILSNPVEPGCVSYRLPRWYAVRFGKINENLMLRLLNMVDLPYRIFTYQHQVARRRETTRSWLPGYMFVEFDIHDNWGQLLRIPGVIEILGDPTPLDEGVVEDLVDRLPKKLPKNASGTVIAIGSTVRILDGTFRGYEAKVIVSNETYVTVLWMMFGHLREQVLKLSDVEVVGAER